MPALPLVTAYEVHAEGEPGRVITEGLPDLPGNSVFEKMQHMHRHHDALRLQMLREPRGNPGRWATPNDYPSRALREEREGVASFTVTVDTDGRVTSCRITRSSGHDDLDEATCKNIERRARFRPATDGNGQETTGTWSSSVRWQIPD